MDPLITTALISAIIAVFALMFKSIIGFAIIVEHYSSTNKSIGYYV